MSHEELDAADEALNPSGVRCARCGEVARGAAFIGSDRLCHPNNPARPDCYTLACHENPVRTGPDIVGRLLLPKHADPIATDLDLEGTAS